MSVVGPSLLYTNHTNHHRNHFNSIRIVIMSKIKEKKTLIFEIMRNAYRYRCNSHRWPTESMDYHWWVNLKLKLIRFRCLQFSANDITSMIKLYRSKIVSTIIRTHIYTYRRSAEQKSENVRCFFTCPFNRNAHIQKMHRYWFESSSERSKWQKKKENV